MKIAVVQLNYIVGDIRYNSTKIIDAVEKLKGKVDIAVFSELSVIGYPPMDLLENSKLLEDNLNAATKIAGHAEDIAVVFGFACKEEGVLYNSAALAIDKKIAGIQHKGLLPTYDVFDEHRYFSVFDCFEPFEFKGNKIGLTICEDIWNSSKANKTFMDNRSYDFDPFDKLVNAGCDYIINISASPFVSGKGEHRISFISGLARKSGIPVVYCNQVGGNDSLIFDGTSFITDKDGNVVSLAKRFEEDIIIADIPGESSIKPVNFSFNSLDNLRSALVLGVRDYVRKCGFSKVIIGLSGGIDSALTAVIAVDALGADNVMGVTMPSRFSSEGSVDDSVKLAEILGIRIETVPIKTLHDQYLQTLSSVFSGYSEDVTEENIQARIRGTLLMAMSNKFNALLLTTGNKSELAMGYCTLYGDMSGGLAVISDLPKTTVFELSRHINKEQEIIPWNTIEKPPSAELRENQKDQDSLPPYEQLDEILRLYISERSSSEEIIGRGFEPELVNHILRTVDRNEYKRRQAAPGLKVTSKAFGTGRRVPVVQRTEH